MASGKIGKELGHFCTELGKGTDMDKEELDEYHGKARQHRSEGHKLRRDKCCSGEVLIGSAFCILDQADDPAWHEP